MPLSFLYIVGELEVQHRKNAAVELLRTCPMELFPLQVETVMCGAAPTHNALIGDHAV